MDKTRLLRRVVITGAGGGLGFALVHTFVERGYEVIACFRKFDGREKVLMEQLSQLDVKRVSLFELDLSDIDQIDNFAKVLKSKGLTVDVLINNAGIAHGTSFLLTKIKDIEECFKINLIGPLRLSQNIARDMTKLCEGSIVFISSVTASEAVPGTLAYALSKSAVSHLSKIMAQELAQFGVRVNCIAPGLVDTQMLKLNSLQLQKKLIDNSAQKRVAAASEVAEAAFFLASPASSHINGQVLAVDGGRP